MSHDKTSKQKAAQAAPERPKYAPPKQQAGFRGPRGGGHGGSGEKAINFLPSLKRLLKHFKNQRVALISVIFLTLIATVLSAVGPIILARATDHIFDGLVLKTKVFDSATLGKILLIALGVYLLYFALSWISALIVNVAVQKSMFEMREKVSTKLSRVPLSKFDSLPRGELLSRVTNDIDNVAQTMQQSLSQILNNLFTVVAVTTMMFIVSWKLALVALISIPVALFITVFIAKRAQKLFASVWKLTGELNSQVEETYTGHDVITVFGKRRETFKRFKETNEKLFKSSLGAQFISSIIMPVMFFVGNLNYVVVAIFGGIMVAGGTLQIGAIQAFIQYTRMFTHPITHLASMANLLQSGVASAERVFEVLDFENMSDDGSEHLPKPLKGEVRFDRISFAYSEDRPLIQDISLTIPAGRTVAIVGPTGAGKTTLVNLLLRFYELNSGSILLDGKDISSTSRSELRSRIGMVLQDTWLFTGTIYENIKYGNENATHEEVMSAAKAAYVDNFVRTLPDGYETVINDEASNLSVGEKQLITIARAFLTDPELLILDEATSSVDTRTEVLIQRAMEKLKSDRTAFIIAHRLSTIKDADIILVMVDGNIVENGSREELLQADGVFAELYRSQLTEVDEPGE